MAEQVFDLRVLERRMSAVTAVGQVVHAIWALARAQLPLVEQASADASAYLDWVDEVVARLAGAPLPRTTRNRLYVILGPERPYCGALSRRVLAQLPADGSVGLVGSRLVESAMRRPGLVSRTLFTLPGAVSHDEHDEIAHRIAEAVLFHASQSHVELLYPRGGGSTLRTVVLLAGEREPVRQAPETWSPLREVLAQAVKESVASRLAVGVAEALRAEVRARIMAAEMAHGACDRKLDELREAWRIARQEQITNELIEVVAGRQAALGLGATRGGGPP